MTVTAEDLIKTLAAKAAGAVTGAPSGPAPKKTGSVQVSSDTTQHVYDEKLFGVAKSMGLDPSDSKVVAEAKRLTKAQIGDGNYASWQKSLAGEAEEVQQETEQEKKEAAALPKIGDPYDSATNEVQKMTAEATKMGKKMRFESWKASKLDSGTGATGFVTRAAAGTMGLASATGHALDSATSEPISYATDTGANVVSEMAKGKGAGSAVVSGVKQEGQHVVSDLKSINQQVDTSMDIATGRMQELYEQLKPAVSDFDGAFKHFDEGRNDFLACGDMPDKKDWITPMKKMESAMDQMREASKRFDGLSASIGLNARAAEMDTFSQETGEGGAGHIMSFASNFIDPEGGAEKGVAKEVTKVAVESTKSAANKEHDLAVEEEKKKKAGTE
jgi:hypothetical protein